MTSGEGKMQREARKLLDASGLTYEIVEARRHDEVFLEGVRVLVLSKGPGHGRNCNALKVAIRRALEVKA